MSVSVVNEHRPMRINRLKAAPLCDRHVVRLQVSNVLARNCSTIGVQGIPKLLIGSFMRNVEPQCLCPLGRLTVRHAVGGLDREAIRSECLTVMVGILGEIFPAP